MMMKKKIQNINNKIKSLKTNIRNCLLQKMEAKKETRNKIMKKILKNNQKTVNKIYLTKQKRNWSMIQILKYKQVINKGKT